MTHALFFTAYDRPEYLRQTLESWKHVRGLHDWDIFARIEPGPRQSEMYQIFEDFFRSQHHDTYAIDVNPEVYGVLHHPYVGFSELFAHYDFVVRAEDDLIVSDDILEYFTWAEETYRHREGVATVHGFSRDTGYTGAVTTLPEFNPWMWGTWKSVWMATIGPLWDHDYSTNNGVPGVEAGWDWNLNTRIFPKYGYEGVYPVDSRVDNIGAWGVHGTPDNLEKALSFQESYGTLVYLELTS